MEKMDPDKNLDAQEARQGKTLGVMRWVLLASLILVVLGFVLARLMA
ncbi:hypothetical protein [Roseococcus microcysteis]|nr:hypothetical protein [Roseococcus microcysteis]